MPGVSHENTRREVDSGKEVRSDMEEGLSFSAEAYSTEQVSRAGDPHRPIDPQERRIRPVSTKSARSRKDGKGARTLSSATWRQCTRASWHIASVCSEPLSVADSASAHVPAPCNGSPQRAAQRKRAMQDSEHISVTPRTPLLDTSVSNNGWVCGESSYGQLGRVVDVIRHPVPLHDHMKWASIDVSAGHTIGISAAGEVYCWGRNEYGQLGNDSEATKENSEGLEKQPVLVTKTFEDISIVAVGAGARHSIVAAGDALFVWGSNEYGQLGCGETHSEPVTSPMMLRWLENVTVTQLTCGDEHSIVVTNQSTVYAWGSNVQGQLGLGDQKLRARPVRLDRLWGIPISSVAAGGAHSLAVTMNGLLFSWGSNSHGQLGHPHNVSEAEEMHKKRTSAMRAQARAKLDQRKLSSLMDMGFSKARAELALLETGNNGVEVAIEWLLQGDSDAEKRALRDWTLAGGEDGEKGPAKALAFSAVPKRVVQLSEIKAVAAGANHTIICCARGVYACGSNTKGQLGLGSIEESQLVPVRIKRLAQHRIKLVSAGAEHSVFVSESGRVFGAGSVARGQFAPEEAAEGAEGYSTPVRVVTPFLARNEFSSSAPLLHEVRCSGNSTAFLIRSPDDTVYDPASFSLMASLISELSTAEAEAAAAARECRPELPPATVTQPSQLRIINAYIMMVFGNATALCAAFGLPSDEGFATQIQTITSRILALYDPAKVEASAAERAPGVTDAAVRATRKAFKEWNHALRDEMRQASVKIVEDIQQHVKHLAVTERAMLLLFAAQNILLEEHPFAQLVLPKLCHSVLSAPSSTQQLLVRWWSTYPIDILEHRVVNPLQSYISKELQATKKLTLSVMNAIKVLAKVEEAASINLLLQPEVFYNQLISDKMDMQDHYLAWRQSHNNDHRSPAGMGPFSFCSFPFLLNAKAKTRLLQVEAKMQMEQTVAEARLEQVYQHYKKRGQAPCEVVALTDKDRIRAEMLRAEAKEKVEGDRERRGAASSGVGRFVMRLMRAGSTSASGAATVGGGASTRGQTMNPQSGMPATDAERRFAARELSHDQTFRDRHPDACVVRVRRGHLVEDAMDEISRQLKKDMLKPLRVHFIGEEGIDAGGVKKEFFQLLVTELLSPDYGLLTFNPESRTYWFNHWATSNASLDSLDVQQSLTDFRLLGVTIGLAIYNNVLLDFPLPIALYRKLCHHSVTLWDLEQMQPTVGRSLRKLLEYTGPGTVEDVFCQVFAVEEEVAGSNVVVELVPGGADVPVTEENRREFVEKYVEYVLHVSVERQFAAFKEGLDLLCKGPAITLFSPVEMERLVCGNPHLDFQALQKAAKYEGGFTAKSRVVEWLWDIAQNEFDMAEKKMFLKFFTGSDRAPVGGLGSMRAIIQRDGPDSHKLPTSHTCFNTLLLPEYARRDKLLDRVRLAILNAEGFGLE